MRLSFRLAAGLLPLALGSCLNVTPPGALFASSPPGARVIVDGVDSGHVTPCRLDVGTGDHTLRFELAGFDAREVDMYKDRRTSVVRWRDGATPPNGMSFPLSLGLQDFFQPFRVDKSPASSRVFVRLQRRELQ